MEKIKIAEGITLNYLKTDKFKTNYLSVNFLQYLNREKSALYALVPQVLIRGTAKHKDIASIKNVLDDLYAASVEARVYKRGEYQVCGMTASWLADKYAIDGTDITEGTLNMLEKIIFAPYLEKGIFSESYVESEKKDLIDDIRAVINNKNSYAVTRCKQEMCKNEAYGISEYGEEEDVRKITPETLFKAYNELLETSVVEVFYVGSGDRESVYNRITGMFEGRKRNCIPLKKTEVVREVSEVKNVTEKISAAQGKLSLGFRTDSVMGEKDYCAFPVFVEMYGNSPVSKLFMNVREKLSLCYYCRAIPDGLKGVMVVTSGIECSNKDKAQNEIIAQLEAVKKGEVSEEELVLAKKSLKNAYKELEDSPVALEGWYLMRRLAGLNDTHTAVSEGFMAVTKEDIVRTANKIKLDTVYFLEGVSGGEEADEDE